MLENIYLHGSDDDIGSVSPSIRSGGLLIAKNLAWPYQSVWADAALVLGLNVAASVNWAQVRAGPSWQGYGALLRSEPWKLQKTNQHEMWRLEGWIPFHFDIRYPKGNIARFRYCRRCLAIGYHSPLYMLPWVTHCPFHPHQALETPCEQCQRTSLGAYLKPDHSNCTTCGCRSIDPRELVHRYEAPDEGVALIQQYRLFVAKTQTLIPLTWTGFGRDWDGMELMVRTPLLRRPIDYDSPTMQDVCIAISILAKRLGFPQLTEQIMKTPIPHVQTTWATKLGDEQYESRFASKYAEFQKWDGQSVNDRLLQDAAKNGAVLRVVDASGYGYPYIETRSSSGYQQTLKQFQKRLRKIFHEDQTCGCSGAKAIVAGHKQERPLCKICCALSHCLSKRQKGRRSSSQKGFSVPLDQLPFPREFYALPSRELDSILASLLELDIATYLLAINREFKDCTHKESWVDVERNAWRQSALFEHFISYEMDDEIIIHIWNEPPLERVLSDALQEYRCSEMEPSEGDVVFQTRHYSTPVGLGENKREQAAHSV